MVYREHSFVMVLFDLHATVVRWLTTQRRFHAKMREGDALCFFLFNGDDDDDLRKGEQFTSSDRYYVTKVAHGGPWKLGRGLVPPSIVDRSLKFSIFPYDAGQSEDIVLSL